MNDVLSRLVDRSRGTARVVRPRLPTRFELPSAAAADEPVAQAEERVVAPVQAPSDAPLRPPRADDRGARDAVAAAAPAEPQSARKDREVSAPVARIHDVERVRETRVESSEPTVRVPPNPAPPDATRVVLPAPPPSVPPREARQVVHVFEPAQESGTPGGPAAERRAETPAASARVQATGVRAVAHAPPERRADAPRAQPPDAHEPPVVRVTIGRIDVRALPEPPAPKREKPERPRRLELDEYLRRRRGDR